MPAKTEENRKVDMAEKLVAEYNYAILTGDLEPKKETNDNLLNYIRGLEQRCGES